MTAAAAIHRTLELVIGLTDRPPHPDVDPAVSALISDLRTDPPPRPPYETEDMIWACWSTHADDRARDGLERAIAALAGGEHAKAEEELNLLCRHWPTWAEAWNKRATLHYVTGQDVRSLGDIQQTLLREPRHFGALAGFGHICMRHGDRLSARIGFEAALQLNPHLAPIRNLVSALGDTTNSVN